ncbi:2-polyprenyl-6-methoxyphenol hydroxylase-like FAD-dependent oxidoreductase [Streptomyces sp. 3211.6]|uniref:FAD-dependent monooxygenase n=1 Tax=Streptomyces TaxID=1883 RepID=UPI0009A4DB51|nr:MULTISPECIES: FAD-dependent monooxygenase [Streptomyces]RKT05621.1 2-polyprenyl-6-methoxyphenol hydroxylase-like FAD-dependent oxidoreductase [Streptomyces sp. 3211.6]
MRGGTVAVVGGSIAGCAFASAAVRAGAGEVVVLERTRGRLADRGVGLCVHDDRAAELVAAGALPPGIPAHRLERRRWVVRDAGAGAGGRLIWEQPFPFHSYHWGLLWRGLREAVPGAVDYRQGVAVAGVDGDGDGAGGVGRGRGRVGVRFGGGGVERFDLVVGADGYRSVVREAVSPGATPHYAGYVCWRGNFDAALLEGLGGAESYPAAVTTVCFPGGSCVIYRIPGPEGLRVNWVLYAAPPPGAGLRFDDPTSFPPGALGQELAAHLRALLEREFPEYWGRALALTAPGDTFVQPIYDLVTEPAAAGRLLLAGDAASVVRPHNTSGAAKALQDATAFGAAWARAGSWEELVAGYQAARGGAGRELVALARRLGRAQVEETPVWARMSAAEVAGWWEGQLAGAAGIGGQAMSS